MNRYFILLYVEILLTRGQRSSLTTHIDLYNFPVVPYVVIHDVEVDFSRELQYLTG